MLKTNKILLTALLLLLAGRQTVLAGSDTLLLWYPGAEGSAEQAAPLLETWTDYLYQKGLPIKLKPIYSNQPVKEGMVTINNIKPAAAILSLEAFLHLSEKYPLTLLAQTRKQPAADGSFSYCILQNEATPKIETLYLSEPLTEDFMHNVILRDTPDLRKLPLQYTDQTLHILQKIGRGELPAAILINDYEETVLKKMNAEWTRSLKKIADSPKLPSPPLVLFAKWQGRLPKEKLVSLLLEMEKDPEGIEILNELRMKGFMPPKTEDYESLRTRLKAP